MKEKKVMKCFFLFTTLGFDLGYGLVHYSSDRFGNISKNVRNRMKSGWFVRSTQNGKWRKFSMRFLHYLNFLTLIKKNRVTIDEKMNEPISNMITFYREVFEINRVELKSERTTFT